MTSTSTHAPAARATELIEGLGAQLRELAGLSADGVWGQVPTGGAADLVTVLLGHRDLLDAVTVDQVREVAALLARRDRLTVATVGLTPLRERKRIEALVRSYR